MRFSTILALLVPAGAAVAQPVWNVTVGNNGSLTFDPDNLTGVQTGDMIQFFFASNNHTVTQSSFTEPCIKLNASAIDSGFMPISSSVTTNVFPGNNSAIPTFNFTVANASTPLWFYCQQTNPVNHCEKGMVFAINPSADKSFSAFQQNANNTNATTVPSGSSLTHPLSVGMPSALLGGLGLIALLL